MDIRVEEGDDASGIDACPQIRSALLGLMVGGSTPGMRNSVVSVVALALACSMTARRGQLPAP